MRHPFTCLLAVLSVAVFLAVAEPVEDSNGGRGEYGGPWWTKEGKGQPCEKKEEEPVAEESERDKLIAGFTFDYLLAWDDEGSKADSDVSLYRPTPPAGYALVGTVAVKGYNEPTKQIIVLAPSTSDSVATEASEFTQMYADHGTGAYKDGSVWRPVCPAGYSSVSDFGQEGYEWPGDLYGGISLKPCIVNSCLAQCSASWIWDDRGSGGSQDVALFKISGGVDRYGSDVGYGGGFFRATGYWTEPPVANLLLCINPDCVTET